METKIISSLPGKWSYLNNWIFEKVWVNVCFYLKYFTSNLGQSNHRWECHCSDIRHIINGYEHCPTMSHWEWVEAFTQLIMTAVSNKNKLFFYFFLLLLTCSTSAVLVSEHWTVTAEVRQEEEIRSCFPIRKQHLGVAWLFLFLKRLLMFTSGVYLETNGVKLSVQASREVLQL